jgi:hypothetical protein
MSSQDVASSEARGRQPKRLDQLKRALQKRLNRKPTTFEKAALDNAALLALRSEIASRDPASDSSAVVRLANCARRALRDFEAAAALDTPKRKAARSMADIEAEVARHV